MFALTLPPPSRRGLPRTALLGRLVLSGLWAFWALSLAAPASSAQTLQTGVDAARVIATLAGENARVELEGRRLVDVVLGREAEISSLVAAGDRWLLAGSRVAVDGRRRLAILAGDDLGWREIPAPPASRARARSGAVLLGDPDGLELRSELVLAWLEGDGSQRQSVHAARFEDGRFAEPELVAAAGPGSQVALRGVVLADGTPLLVWNAFDGDDNEIVWSWSRGGRWSAPQRIGEDNRVPDVAPTLLASGTGALAVWSRYDGHGYRLMASRLGSSGSEWSAPAPIGGVGSMPERLLAAGDDAVVLYLEAGPRRWSVARLEMTRDGSPRLRTSATVTTPRGDPPLVTLPDASTVELEWAAPLTGSAERAGTGSVVVVPWQDGPPRRSPRSGR